MSEEVTWETCFRTADVRWPPFWAGSRQPPGRWHGAGEGPAHYLASSPQGAWAEVLRHTGVTEPDDVADLTRSLWSVRAPISEVEGHHPDLPWTRRLGRVAWSTCQAATRRLRESGARSLMAPSAALPRHGTLSTTVDEEGRVVTEGEATWVYVFYGHPDAGPLKAEHCADGPPDPSLTDRVSRLVTRA